MITDLVPQSIKNNQTTSYDLTWEERIKRLNIDQLLVNIETETNPIKLEYWLQMFGIDTSIFDFSTLNEPQRILLLQKWLDILMKSGSEYSIKQMALILGATSCDIFYGDSLNYDGVANHDNLYYHDGGSAFSQFSIHVNVFGIPLLNQSDFNTKFRKLMKTSQPIRIYLKNLNIFT